jgi:hypothetical protein
LPLPVRIRRTADFAVIGLFLVGIGIVSYGTLFREPPPLTENRNRHRFPPLNARRYVIQDFPKRFELYYGDRVGFRDLLLNGNQWIMYEQFGESVSNFGWVGRDGWFFLSVDDPFAGVPGKPSLDERVEEWANALADRHAYLKARGIRYVVLIPPDKSSVFPEYLRGYAARHPPPALAARLVERLTARGVPCVNPLPTLMAEKKKARYPLYYTRDSHWTFDGARVGYELLAAELPDLHPRPWQAFAVVEQSFETDLGRMVGAPESEWLEMARYPVVRGLDVHQDDEPAFRGQLPPGTKYRVLACASAAGPHMVFFHDSFGEQLIPFLTTDCRRVAAVATDTLELPVLDAEKPSVVVQEMVARKLYHLTPFNPPEVKGYRNR